MSKPIPRKVLELKIKAPLNLRNLSANNFEAALGDEPTLLVFLRHFG